MWSGAPTQPFGQPQGVDDGTIGRQQIGVREVGPAAPTKRLSVEASRLAAPLPHDPHIEKHFAVRVSVLQPQQWTGIPDGNADLLGKFASESLGRRFTGLELS